MMCLKTDALPKISKKNGKCTKNCHVESVKNQRRASLFQRQSALFRDFQVMNSAETDLKLFWIRADQRWMSLRRQPGCLSQISIEWSSFCSIFVVTLSLYLSSMIFSSAPTLSPSSMKTCSSSKKSDDRMLTVIACVLTSFWFVNWICSFGVTSKRKASRRLCSGPLLHALWSGWTEQRAVKPSRALGKTFCLQNVPKWWTEIFLWNKLLTKRV